MRSSHMLSSASNSGWLLSHCTSSGISLPRKPVSLSSHISALQPESPFFAWAKCSPIIDVTMVYSMTCIKPPLNAFRDDPPMLQDCACSRTDQSWQSALGQLHRGYAANGRPAIFTSGVPNIGCYLRHSSNKEHAALLLMLGKLLKQPVPHTSPCTLVHIPIRCRWYGNRIEVACKSPGHPGILLALAVIGVCESALNSA